MPQIAKRNDEPERGRSAIEDELSDLHDEFLKLSERAREAGFSTAVILVGYDPISNEGYCTRGYCGHYYSVLGAVRAALREWEGDT